MTLIFAIKGNPTGLFRTKIHLKSQSKLMKKDRPDRVTLRRISHPSSMSSRLLRKSITKIINKKKTVPLLTLTRRCLWLTSLRLTSTIRHHQRQIIWTECIKEINKKNMKTVMEKKIVMQKFSIKARGGVHKQQAMVLLSTITSKKSKILTSLVGRNFSGKRMMMIN